MKKNKKKKLLLLILFFIWLSASVYLVQITYAKYLSAFDSTAAVMLSRWSIKVNGVDVAQNETFSEAIVPTFPGSDYIKSDSFVPRCSWLF